MTRMKKRTPEIARDELKKHYLQRLEFLSIDANDKELEINFLDELNQESDSSSNAPSDELNISILSTMSFPDYSDNDDGEQNDVVNEVKYFEEDKMNDSEKRGDGFKHAFDFAAASKQQQHNKKMHKIKKSKKRKLQMNNDDDLAASAPPAKRQKIQK